MEESHNRVQWVYSSTSNEELQGRYDQWAPEYEQDLVGCFAWNAPGNASALLEKYVAKPARILDAGAGTGLVGVSLRQLGYTDLVAIDLSAGMLEEAHRKQVYSEFHQMVLGETLDFEIAEFDAVISVGVFTFGHAPASAFDELVRVTKPGGYIVFSLRTDVYENNGFREMQDGLTAAGKWELAEMTDQFRPMPKGEPEVWHRDWAYRVN